MRAIRPLPTRRWFWMCPAVFMAAMCGAFDAGAVDFRLLQPIQGPETVGSAASEIVLQACGPELSCADLLPVPEIQPVHRRTVERAFRRIARAWNSSDLESLMADQFFDKTRLLDTISEVVPRDARLRILAIRNVQTLAQFLQPATPERAAVRVSIVSTRVGTQVEYNDPNAGFIRSKEALQEYVLVITDEPPPLP